MGGTKRRFKLEKLNTITGNPFREVEMDEDGNPILDLRLDSKGDPVMQVPRDNSGNPVPNAQPENVYNVRSKAVEKALPLLLKRLYLELPIQKTTRQDTIYGTRLFAEIEASPEGELVLSEDIHKWLQGKLQDEGKGEGKDYVPGIGLGIFGKSLQIVENALDSYERTAESKGKD